VRHSAAAARGHRSRRLMGRARSLAAAGMTGDGEH
jgi:hypothetical protein